MNRRVAAGALALALMAGGRSSGSDSATSDTDARATPATAGDRLVVVRGA
ncbi:MAG: hypothetical protein M3203_08350 [Actinomycetota bacterium]|nr:hypothetical protein [Actinomycetota bacterium]